MFGATLAAFARLVRTSVSQRDGFARSLNANVAFSGFGRAYNTTRNRDAHSNDGSNEPARFVAINGGRFDARSRLVSQHPSIHDVAAHGACTAEVEL